MPLPKRKNNIKVYTPKENLERRIELNKEITENDTFLPDGILHSDLDLGMLEFAKENFVVVSGGKRIAVFEKILTIQKWGEYNTTWENTDRDNNLEIPFIAVIRKPDAQPGTNPVTKWTIPDRKNYFYNSVIKWTGNEMVSDVYKIPQPVAIDISYDIVITCQTIDDVNKFNKVMLQKFSSRQAYTKIKGHYIPIILDNIGDSSPISNTDARRFYQQTYKLTMMGYLLDPDEFEVVPTISRALLMTDINKPTNRPRRVSEMSNILTSLKTGDGTTSVYSVEANIGHLFNITVDDMVMVKDVDFYHVVGSNRVSFVNPPKNGENIKFIFYSGKVNEMTDFEGEPLNYAVKEVTFEEEECFYYIHFEKPIKEIITVAVDGKILTPEEEYIFIPSLDIQLLNDPGLGKKVEVIYLF